MYYRTISGAMSKIKIRDFKKEVWKYYRVYRRDFPWRITNNPYHILVSEMMLQQTQTHRVEPKYKLFLRMFPTVSALARASTSKVLEAWQGLGYNRRALFLQRAAKAVVENHDGKVPPTLQELQDLPGVGPNTAGAIMAFAFNQPVVFIETNIRRVFIHFFFPDTEAVHDQKLLPLIQETIDPKKAREWYYALMDYGAMLAKTLPNPNRRSVHYAKQSVFKGSRRQVRGGILKMLLKRPASLPVIIKTLARESALIKEVLASLQKEGFVIKRGQVWHVKKGP